MNGDFMFFVWVLNLTFFPCLAILIISLLLTSKQPLTCFCVICLVVKDCKQYRQNISHHDIMLIVQSIQIFDSKS